MYGQRCQGHSWEGSMLSPDGLAKHKGWLRKHPPASSALPGVRPEEEQDTSMQGQPLICSHGDPPTRISIAACWDALGYRGEGLSY